MTLVAQDDLHLLPDTAEMVWGLIAFLVIPGMLIALSIYAARDMNRRGDSGLLYGLLVFFALPVGLIVWLLMRARLDERADVGASG